MASAALDAVTHIWFRSTIHHQPRLLAWFQRHRVDEKRGQMKNDKEIEGDAELPQIDEVLRDPAASFWLKDALRSALERDPVDAANDARVLARLLNRRSRAILSES